MTVMSLSGGPSRLLHRLRPGHGSALSTWLTLAAATIAAVAAAASGLASLQTTRTWVYIPLLAGVGLALGVLALTRFAAFVYLLLATRTVVDLFKLSASAAGNTATNSASARGLDPSTLLGVLFLVAGMLWLAAQYRSRERVPMSRLGAAWLVLIAAGALSVLGATSPLVSLMGLLRMLAVAVMFLVLEQLLRDARSIRNVLTAAFLSLVFPLAYTLFGFLIGSPAADIKSSYTRITGPFNQSTTFARYLAFFLVFGVALLPYLRGKAKWLVVTALSLSSVFLMLTLTRGALVAAVLGLLFVLVAQRRGKAVLALAAGGLVALLLVPGLSSRLDAVTTEDAVGTGPTSNTLEWRFAYWAETLPLANRNPVNGIGVDMTQYQTDVAKQPHNDFLKAYVETGLVGLAAYLFLVWQLVSVGVKAVRRTAGNTLNRAVAIGYAACAGMFVIESIAANVISSVVILWYLVTFAAVTPVIARIAPVTSFRRLVARAPSANWQPAAAASSIDPATRPVEN
ncbi:MAG TPA: O-antigen ligase family protein [Dermatophilaceae bacterium]|nr:O-antigen ligase family protein [Dermatophilaceae bacterium]